MTGMHPDWNQDQVEQLPFVAGVDTASVDYNIRVRRSETVIPWTTNVRIDRADAAGLRRHGSDWDVKPLGAREEWARGEWAPIVPSEISTETAWVRIGRLNVSSATQNPEGRRRNLMSLVFSLQRWRAVRTGSSSVILERRELEPLSETLWIQVGEIKRNLEELLKGEVYLYTTDDGAFVVDAVFTDGRAACVIRKEYVHLMILKNSVMTDEVVEGTDTVRIVIEKLRKQLD